MKDITRYWHQAERARDVRQPSVYVLNHSQHKFRQRTTRADLDEIEDWTDRAARRMCAGAGLGPNDVDIFNPPDSYAPMAQFFLEAFQWHGKPMPLRSTRAISGSRDRTRSARAAAIWGTGAPLRPDSIEQLRSTAGAAGQGFRAETALAAFTTPSGGGWIMFGKQAS
jgi:hypothetical protein